MSPDVFVIDATAFYVILFGLSVLVMLKGLHNLTRKPSNIPAVQGGWPFLGQVFAMIKGSPWETMTRWMHQYGTIYRFHLFGNDAICVSDPKLLEFILNTKMSVFKKDLEWTYKPFLVILGNGLVTADGNSWRKQRVLLSHHLRIDILENIPAMAWRAVGRLCKKLDKVKAENGVIEMAEEFRHLTLQVIAEAVLSLSPEESDNTFAHMYLPIVMEGNLRTWDPTRMYIPTPAWFKFNRDVDKLNSYVTTLIEKRWALRQQESSNKNRVQDVLDKILSAIPASEWNAEACRQIRDEIKTFILAGHETSASMLTWALYELSIMSGKPHLVKLTTEAREAYPDSLSTTANGGKEGAIEYNMDVIPARAQLDKLVFSECCLRESLRKYSNVPTVVRTCSQDIDMDQYHIAKGSTLMINMMGVHHNPNLWPEPSKYLPDRFLKPVAPYTFLPFIDGPRQCLGQFLALLESKIVLSMLLNKYSFEVVNLEDAGLTHPFMVPIIPKTGHFMKVK